MLLKWYIYILEICTDASYYHLRSILSSLLRIPDCTVSPPGLRNLTQSWRKMYHLLNVLFVWCNPSSNTWTISSCCCVCSSPAWPHVLFFQTRHLMPPWSSSTLDWFFLQLHNPPSLLHVFGCHIDCARKVVDDSKRKKVGGMGRKEEPLFFLVTLNTFLTVLLAQTCPAPHVFPTRHTRGRLFLKYVLQYIVMKIGSWKLTIQSCILTLSLTCVTMDV